ncbi:predicted protein [Sclerotinia sclerotiorum 1980 UF-70]|uniref:Uncharacterized protein n=1 Tax=Sclerotinia sclerotiorum (strain ATCC 18683 / 1980 / Ss-1) TaxID=665079 RepID=A7ENE9_SCLS1|nr:predicted protein [Sclerotinia sclerotiorum 1980 UF-70]EDO04365.1 predicted protein [Sclerotinia sclerotiorum 1980 UF-70]
MPPGENSPARFLRLKSLPEDMQQKILSKRKCEARTDDSRSKQARCFLGACHCPFTIKPCFRNWLSSVDMLSIQPCSSFSMITATIHVRHLRHVRHVSPVDFRSPLHLDSRLLPRLCAVAFPSMNGVAAVMFAFVVSDVIVSGLSRIYLINGVANS